MIHRTGPGGHLPHDRDGESGAAGGGPGTATNDSVTRVEWAQ